MARYGNKRKPDLARVERLYRAGLLAITEIARECVIPEANIRYYAKKLGWKRDLTDEMRTRTRTKLVENLATFDKGQDIVDELRKSSDEELIEQAARTQVQVVREHQKTLGNGHSLTMRMLNELDAMTTHRGELEDMIKSTIAPRRQGALMAASSLGNRAAVLRNLAASAREWVILERQAFNIADDREKDNKEQSKLDQMTAEQLRAEILTDAKKMGLDLNPDDLTSNSIVGVAAKAANGSGLKH